MATAPPREFTSQKVIDMALAHFEGAYVSHYGPSSTDSTWEMQMCWVKNDAPGITSPAEMLKEKLGEKLGETLEDRLGIGAKTLGGVIRRHIAAVDGVRLTEGSFMQQCSVLQDDDIQIQGRQTNLMDFALFEPIIFYVKGPSAYAGGTACSLEGYGVRTAAFHRAEEMIVRTCQEYFDARDERVPNALNIKLAIAFEHYTKLLGYASKYQSEFVNFRNASNAEKLDVMARVYSTFAGDSNTQLVSAMRLATRILRGTRAQISDMHARQAAEQQFNSVISSLCDGE